MSSSRDPYVALGVGRDVSDEQLRAAYRRLVQLNHPDHNGGSAESERRFEEIQDAYARIRKSRARTTAPGAAPASDPHAETRLQQMEREVREAHLARERARRAAREAAAQTERRPTDEDLGYVTTDDNFSKIFADARAELGDRFAEGRANPLVKRIADLLDELDPRRRD